MSHPEDQILSVTPEVVLKAYACGIFPMAESADDPYLHWIEPRERGILPLDGLHVSRRLARTIRRAPYEIRVDTAFCEVMDACAEPGPGRRKTWINSEIRRLYTALHEMGHAHSVEVWAADRLVGGLYGVRLGGAFFGESMFHRVTDASKIALVHLVARLRHGGFRLLDTQFVTEHLQSLGAIEISRVAYQRLLDEAVRTPADFYRLPTSTSSDSVLQLVSQTS